jgi:hemolysin III
MTTDATTATPRELVADRTIHLMGIGLGLPASIAIVVVAAVVGTAGQAASAAVYAVGLVAMFGCSAAYNMQRRHRWRDWLQRLDHAAIFVMIAGTYTPFTLRLEPGWALGLSVAVWAVAGLGVVLKLWRPRRLGTLSVVFYLILGWIGLIAIEPMMRSLSLWTLLLIGLGGLIYSIGVIFHLWQRLPYQNAIWHGFVLTAAVVHYLAVLSTLGV